MRRWTAVCGKERAEPVRNHGVARCGAARVARVHTLGPRSDVEIVGVLSLSAGAALSQLSHCCRPVWKSDREVAVHSWMSTFILYNIYNSSKLLAGAGSPAGPAQATPRSLWRARVFRRLRTLTAPQSESGQSGNIVHTLAEAEAGWRERVRRWQWQWQWQWRYYYS